MCSLRNLAPTLQLCLLLVACSSSGKDGSKDGGSNDGGGAALDGARRDARDSAASTEAGNRLDVPASIDTSKVGDAKDAASSEAGASLDSRDAADARSPGDVKDATKDVPQNTGVLDAAIDVYVPNSCDNPIVIPLDNPHVDLTVTTDGESHDFELPCAAGGSDIVLSFYLDRPEMVYADTFGTPWNTILALSTTCPLTEPKPVDGMVTCSDDDCDSTQSQVFAVLQSGRHYLVLSGSNGESGTATIHFQHAPVGVGSVFGLPPGSGSLTGTLNGIGRLGACEAVGPEQTYWWVSCPDYAGVDFSASTCKSLDLNLSVILFLQTPRNDSTACADNDNGASTCGLQESMTATIPAGAGINSLAVESSNGSGHNTGDYTLDYTRP